MQSPVPAPSANQDPGPTIHATRNALVFTDITASSGIDMSITCGNLPTREILEVNGGGLALIDFDNDSDLDLFVANGATLQQADPAPQRGGGGPGSRLFENIGNLKFRDISADAGIALNRWATGVAVGDYDGDGFDDLYICCYGPNVLLRNNGNETFTDVTGWAIGDAAVEGTRDQAVEGDYRGIEAETSLDPLLPSSDPLMPVPHWSTSAAFGDLDNDGDLDLYVCNYLEFDVNNRPARSEFKGVEVMGGPHGLTPQHDVLYRNHGDGTFIDVTVQSGCLPAKPAFGLNVLIIDFDGDGWQDITVANDSMPDFLFHNKGIEGESTGIEGEIKGIEASRHQGIEGDRSLDALMPHPSMPSFEEIGVISGIAANADGGNQASMGLAIADVDGNGLPDKFTTVFSSDVNALHLNSEGIEASRDQGIKGTGESGSSLDASMLHSSMPLQFEDRSQQYGLAMISRPYLGWSAGFFDFDHDGDEDLLFVNGHVYPEATMETMDSEYEQPPLLFERDDARFKRVTAERGGEWLAEKHRDRNAVFADFDADGDIDIIIGELNGPIRMLRNDSNSNGWLIVELKDDRAGSKNHRCLGAKIEAKVSGKNGGSTHTRWLFTGGGFQSSGAHYAHFGLGELKDDDRVDVTITWPDGHRQQVDGVQPNQHLIVRRTE